MLDALAARPRLSYSIPTIPITGWLVALSFLPLICVSASFLLPFLPPLTSCLWSLSSSPSFLNNLDLTS